MSWRGRGFKGASSRDWECASGIGVECGGCELRKLLFQRYLLTGDSRCRDLLGVSFEEGQQEWTV